MQQLKIVENIKSKDKFDENNHKLIEFKILRKIRSKN